MLCCSKPRKCKKCHGRLSPAPHPPPPPQMISRGSPDITSRPYYNQNKPLLGSFSLMPEVRVCLRAEHIYLVAATYPPPRSLAVRSDVATLKRRQCCFPSSRIIYFYSEKREHNELGPPCMVFGSGSDGDKCFWLLAH